MDCCQSGACVLTIAPFRWPLLADHEVLATVDDKKSARDEGSLVGDQEEFCVRHVPLAAGSSHEAAFGPGVPASTSSRLVPSWPTPVFQRRIHETRQDRVGAHTAFQVANG